MPSAPFRLARHRSALLLPCVLLVFHSAGSAAQATGASTAKKQSPRAATAPPPLQLAPVRDPHSFGNPLQVAVKNIDLDLTVDFARRVLSGSAVLTLDRRQKDAPLTLDSEKLAISSIETAPPQGAFAKTRWLLGKPDDALGIPITIELPAGATRVRLAYETSPAASALQWLAPEQTAGGKHPYLYTQNESIHARSWLPTQDSPGVRVTYSATIHAPRELVAVMSAEGDPQPRNGAASLAPTHAAVRDFHFKMSRPVPSYLIALAVGDLAFRPIGARAGVYDEPSLVDRDAREFSDLEKMIATTERLYGPYQWGRYDVLVLPPSFPYGGMENPRLTFASQTIIAGDKSLVSVISHELAHSWSGNYVTNATWNDFWLNEGVTTYIERRIVEAVFGPKRAEQEIALGRQVLDRELRDEPAADQALHPAALHHDPDDGMVELDYEKGSLLLRLLEKKFGRRKFDAFLRGYFAHFAWHSITTADFAAYLKSTLFAQEPQLAADVPLDEWLYQPGLPGYVPAEGSDAFAAVEAEARLWLDGKKAVAQLNTSDWSSQQWQHFLRFLPRDLGAPRMEELDQRFHFTDSGNIEVTEQWLLLTIANHYLHAGDKLEKVLMTVGRGKIIRPLYAEMAKSPEWKRRAVAYYKEARPHYHPILQKQVDEVLGTTPSDLANQP